MGCYVGIDIGAISATAAVVTPVGLAFPDGSEGFELLAGGDPGVGRIYLSRYRRTRGKPVAAATDLLEFIISVVGAEQVEGVCLTGSGSKLAAAKLGAAVVNEFKAIAAGLAATGADVRTVFEIGGETSKYLRLSRNDDGGYGVIDYATNGDCAAGTGAFIDQQAGRLRYPVEQIAEIVLATDRAAQIAGRCSVFAKSDMIHAQQKGYSPAEVLRGLCNAVARNFRLAVVRSHPVEPPVALIGGVAANAAVVRAMQEAFELDESKLVLPQAFTHIPAIGAAALAARGEQAVDLSHMGDLRRASDSARGTFATAAPLSMDNVVLLRDRVEPYGPVYGHEQIDAYLGVDIGSVSTNVVAVDEDGRVITEIYTATLGRPIEVVGDALQQIEREFGRALNIRGVGTTGSGRELIGELIGADTINDEITAHKTGALFVGKTMLDGRIPDTIFEIGGQDSKYISLQDGVVVDFTMNEACAAGTGSFLEERAEELEIAIRGEFAELALSSKAPIRLGERCTVFMERDLLPETDNASVTAVGGPGKEFWVFGRNYPNSPRWDDMRSVEMGAWRVELSPREPSATDYFLNVIQVMDQKIEQPLQVERIDDARDKIAAQAAGRIETPAEAGAALQAAPAGDDPDASGRSLGTYVSELAAQEDRQAGSRFRGYDLSKVDYRLREFTCRGCSNACQIQEFTVESEKTYWGDKCSDRYRKRAKADQKPVIDDLLSFRRDLLLDDSDLPPAPSGGPTVGIPLTMFALDSLPFWRTFLAHCGMKTELSQPTNKTIIQAGLDSAVAEPCFPIIAAHGHVADLAARDIDYIFLPNLISEESRWRQVDSFLCPWHQTLPFVCRLAPALAPHAKRFLSPTVRFRDGRAGVARQLIAFFKPRRIGKRTIRRAVDAAFGAQDAFNAAVQAAGRRAMDTLQQTGAPGIVLMGRPYNTHDAGMCLSVGSKLREYYGVNCIPVDFLDTEPVDVRDINDNMYWSLGRRIIAAAKIVGQHPNLHIIYITNFKCGPDSFIKHFINRASGKPFLTLQFDGHSNDAGMMTRCEAYLDSKGILRPWRREEIAVQTS